MPAYGTSVFVNCPFDAGYQPLFRALVFAIESLGFTARCALEVDDTGDTRAEKIVRLIKESRLGIHDISRTELSPNGLPRFNMPYELGLFSGLRHADDPRQRRKAFLVLDREPYRYQQFLSDIAGQDIRSHGDDPGRLITQVRHWLQNQTRRELAGGDYVRRQYGRFSGTLPRLLKKLHLTGHDLDNFIDYQRIVFSWVKKTSG